MSNRAKWDGLRGEFPLATKHRQFATMVLASTPQRVSESIDRHRDGLDAEGFSTFAEKTVGIKTAVEAVDKYFDTEFGCTAITHNTTMGLAQVLGGVRMYPGQEILTSTNEHAATMETLRFRNERDGTTYRQVPLYRDSRTVTAGEIVRNVEAGIRSQTRVLALTWVYSSDGVKLPLARIGDIVERENARRPRPEDRLLFVVDGVHGFGVEDVKFPDMKCDFFVSGCHKWIFGPRGTGIIAGRREAWPHIVPVVATLASPTRFPALIHIPGGLVAFEHQWALAEAFDFHRNVLVKSEVQARVRELVADFKVRLCALGAHTVTPSSADLSSGIVCFDVKGQTANETVKKLKEVGVIASTSAFDATAGRSHVRFSVSILNNEDDIQAAANHLADIARS